MDATLKRIITACAAGETVQNVGRDDITFRSQRSFDPSRTAALEELLSYSASALGIELKPVGGGYGCANFNFELSTRTAHDRLRTRWTILHDPGFLAGLDSAGFDSLVTRNPSGYVNLRTGATYDGPKVSRSLFCSYSHVDHSLQRQLKAHFAPLRLIGCVALWYDDKETRPGGAIHLEIPHHLQTSSLILLLVSSDFFDSAYIVEHELPVALERHRSRSATVIPVILRPVKWEITPLGSLNALPEHGRPITLWESGIDDAMLNVVDGVLAVLPRD